MIQEEQRDIRIAKRDEIKRLRLFVQTQSR